ncbi:Shikimate dehydrogenase (NADP(+)) [Trichinella spiralis]|uniref:Shikimate dehydrogenase (NADP(+)) n=1 Tax=Trichinella spiralis TaxID=6334 RepID=A0ABR3KJL5_TRISP
MHEIAFLRFSLAKKTTRLQKVVEALLNFEKGYPFDGDQVCVSRTPRRPDLPYINPQIEDTHPFPLILSELASEHQNNRFYDYTCSFWKFLSVKKINPSYAKLNCRACGFREDFIYEKFFMLKEEHALLRFQLQMLQHVRYHTWTCCANSGAIVKDECLTTSYTHACVADNG